MKRATTMIALLSLALAAGPSLRAEGGFNPDYTPASYYGDNDLVDYYQASKIMRKFSESTVALFSDSAIPLDERAGVYKMRDLSLRGKFNLQDGQPFGDQPVGAYCSGVLVAEDMILTAGHCFKPDERGGPCERVKVVFGYAASGAGSVSTSFPAANVYSCRQIVAQEVHDDDHNISCRNGSCTEGSPSGDGPDFALIKLDRKVAGRPPLAISRAAVRPGTKVGAIGHPSGLPVKIQEEGAAVRTVNKKGYFTANLDSFAGNSGSPVFNMETLKIEGILVRGGDDFLYNPATSTSTVVADPRRPYNGYNPGRANYYPHDGGRGEDVTLMTVMQSLIPRGEMEQYLDDAAAMKRQQGQSRPKAVPAIYTPGDAPQVQPAVYYAPAPSVPDPISI